MRSIRWMALFGLTGPLVPAAGAQPTRGPIGVELGGGMYAPLTEFGTVGVARGDERVAPAFGVAVTRRLERSLSIAATATWVWNIGIRVRPTASCTLRCDPFVMSGGRVLVGLATLSWHLPSPVGVFSLTGGAGFKAYRNGGAITACDDQFCGNAGAFQESLTNLVGQVGIGWRPSEALPVGLRLSDVVSKYKTGRLQHDLLLLLDLRLL